jgi:hypothetical protein
MHDPSVPPLPPLNGLLQVTSMFYTRNEQMERTGYWCMFALSLTTSPDAGSQFS